MIPTNKDDPIQHGKVSYWGVPYHGLCRGDTIELPGGLTRAYDQPLNDGSTFVVKNPRKAGLPASMPLSAYDAAQGFSWLTFGILSGAGKMIGGVNLGGLSFIYVDHRERPWIVDLISAGSDWSLRVRQRFGLFGEDSVSWIKNRIIYTGTFDRTGTATEYIDSQDLCQNWDGSSVFLNFRVALAYNKIMPNLLRVVEINITTSDVYPGTRNDVDFSIKHSHKVASSDVLQITSDSYDSRPPSPTPCSIDVIASVDYNYDERFAKWCGPGAFRPGVYSEDGSIVTESAWEDGSGGYGSSQINKLVMKVWYAHSNEEQIMSLVRGEVTDSIYTEICSFSMSASFSRVVTQPDNGDETESGLPCSGLGSTDWEVTVNGGMNSNNTNNNSHRIFGGIYINDNPAITWVFTEDTLVYSYAVSDCDFSASGSFAEGSPSNWPTEFDDVRDECANGYVGGPGQLPCQTSDSDTIMDISTHLTIDGSAASEAVSFGMDNQFIRAYSNNIFALLLVSLIYPEDDPEEPDYYGQYGLYAEGQRPVTGKMLDKGFWASVNPVDGAVTIDQVEPVCYV